MIRHQQTAESVCRCMIFLVLFTIIGQSFIIQKLLLDKTVEEDRTSCLDSLNHRQRHKNDPSIQEFERNFMLHRPTIYDSWFDDDNGLKDNADAIGPILDFAIVGFPKSGTTTLMANLGHIAPMPIRDSCQSLAQTVHDAYKVWPNRYPPKVGQGVKLYRGTKCPRFHNTQLLQFSTHLPRTKLIFGIRHPVRWFESAWLMEAGFFPDKMRQISPYDLTKPCEGLDKKDCLVGHCPVPHLFCVHRSRFHMDLAALGKTPMSTEERQLLAPIDFDGGQNAKNLHIKNKIFLYEQTQLQNETFWTDLAHFLDYPGGKIQHNFFAKARLDIKKNDSNIPVMDICDVQYDNLRKIIMPYAYEISRWVCGYLVPVASDQDRDDVFVADKSNFCSIIQEYEKDPCGRLVRASNGTYVLVDK